MIPTPTMREILLEEFIYPMNLNISEIPVEGLQAVMDGEKDIDAELSKQLADFFGVSDSFFYDIQQDINCRSAVPAFAFA